MAFCSGPFWSDTAPVRELAATELLRTAAARVADALARPPDHPILCAALRQLAEAPSVARPVWAPSVGRALRAASEKTRPGVLLAAIDLVLDFAESVAPFCCRLELDGPARVRLDPLILPPSPWIRIDWRGPALVVETARASASLVLDPCGRRLVELRTRERGAMAFLARRGDVALLTGERGGCFPPLGEPGGSVGDRVIERELADARRCLAHGAPRYADWIFPMVGYAVPVAAPAGQFVSGSSRDAPGVMSISPGAGVIKVAESLVHEASHQYYFLLSRFAKLTDDDPGKRYYSPFVRRERPLDRILLAFHAAANVVSFYALLSRSSAWRPEYQPEFDHGLDDCRVLGEHLRGNPGLCEAGLALYQPIHGWLAERGLA